MTAADASANLNLSGSGNLKKYLEDLNKQFQELNKGSEKQTETFGDLNKEGDKTSELLDKLVKSSKGLLETSKNITSKVADGIKETGMVLTKVIPIWLSMNSKVELVGNSAKGLNFIFKDQLTSSIAKLATSFAGLGIAVPMFANIATGAADAYLQAQGLNDTFSVMQSLGIDTTAAGIAFQFGLVGEKLLFSSQAAKEFGQTAITSFAQLEDAAAFVTTIGAGAAVEFEGLEAGVESVSAAMTELSNDLGNAVSSTEAANALYNALSAGVGVAADNTVRLGETNEFLSASLKLAAGSGSNAAQTLELLAKTSKVYGISNSEAADTAAKLYQIVEQGITTFPELTGVLGNVFSVAKSVGVSMEEAGGSVAALTKIMGSAEAATGLQSLLASIAGQGEQAQKALGDLGVKFDINTVKSKGLITSLNELYAATGGNASVLKEIIPDVTAFRTALALMTSASEDAVATTEKLGQAGEEDLNKLFERRQQSTVQQFTLIMNGFNEVLTDFGRRVLPSIQPGVDFLQTLLNVLQNLPTPIKNAIGAIVIAQTAISNIGGGVLSFGLTIGKLIATIAALRLASKLWSGQLGKEIKVLKSINSAGFDFGKTLTRLIGLNEKLDVETAQSVATLKMQRNIMKQLNNNQIEFDGSVESTKDLNMALKAVREKIRELRDNGLDKVKPVEFAKQEKSLMGLEKQIQKTINQTTNTRKDIFKDFQEKVDKALKNTNLSIDEKKVALKKSLDNYFSTFSETGDGAKAKISEIFENILGNAELTTKEKVSRINSIFKELAQDAAPDVKKSLTKLQGEMLEAVARLDGKFNGEVAAMVTKLNLEFRQIADGKVAQDVKQNVEKVSRVVTSELRGLKDKVNVDTKKINGSLGKVGRAFGSAGDLISNFVPGLGAAMGVLRDTGDVIEDVSDSLPKTVKGTKAAKRGIVDLSKSILNTNINMKTFKGGFKGLTGLFKGGAGSAGIFAKATSAVGGAAGLAGGGIAGLTAALGGLLAAAAPVIAIAGLVGVALYALHNVLKVLIPAYGEATDGTLKLAKGLRNIAKDTDESTAAIAKFTDSLGKLDAQRKMLEFDGFFSAEQREQASTLSDKEFSEIYGFDEEQIRRIRDNTLENLTPDEKSFVQGWRAPVLNMVEFVTKQLSTLDNRLLGFLAGMGKSVANTLENLPIVGGVFDKIGDKFDELRFKIEKGRKEEEGNIRKFINNMRDNIQAGIAAPAREAALESRDAMQGLLMETGKLNNAYKEGGAAYAESSGIIEKAANENRALRGKELQEILANEKKLNEVAREEIQKNIETRQKELEKAKDPEVRKELEFQIEKLQERNTELEKGLAMQEQFLSNANALLSARDQNRAEQGVEQLETRVKQLYGDLSDEAKKVFDELPGAAIDAAGEVDALAGRVTSSSQRRAVASFEVARTTFAQTVADVSDPEKNINPDKVATDLFNVLDAIDKQVAEDVITLEEAQKATETFRNQIFDLEIDGQVQSFKAEEILRADQLKALEQQEIEIAKQISGRKIEEKQFEVSQINSLEQQNLVTAAQAARERNTINDQIGQERIKLEEEILNTIIKNSGATSQAAIDQERKVQQTRNDIAVEGFKSRKAVLDRELEQLKLQKDNEIKVLENAASVEKNLIAQKEKTINLDQSALAAQQELNSAIAGLEQAQLQNKLKFTQDIEEQAQIELELGEARLEALGKEQEFEKENLVLQQELNMLALERQKIELDLQAAQVQTQRIMAESKLAQAEELNLSQEQVKSLQLQQQALVTQEKAIKDNQDQLVKQEETQQVINEKQMESLELRQQAARETSAADVELLKIKEVNAQYEKQKEDIRNRAQLEKLAADEKIQALESQNVILSAQTDLIQKQADLIRESSDLQSRLYGLAKDAATNEFQRKRIEREEAKARLKNLEKLQEMERVNLKIEQMKRDIALEIQKIKADTAIAEREAGLAEAKAEQQRVEADPTSTQAQKDAAAAGVRAQEVGLDGAIRQREALEIQGSFNEFLKEIENRSQGRQFQADRLEAESALAKTTRTRGDDRQVSNRALRAARNEGEEFSQLFQEFNNSAQGFFNQQAEQQNQSSGRVFQMRPDGSVNVGPAPSNNRNQFAGTTGNESFNNMQGRNLGVSGNVNVTLDIKGEGASKIDKDTLQKVASESLCKGLNELFEYSINRQQSQQ